MEELINLKKRVKEITNSEELQKEFTSTSIEKDKRAYSLYNTNIKTLNTYSKYLKSIDDDPHEDHHQKYQILRNLRMYYNGNNPNENKHIQYRQNILRKALVFFDNKSSFARSFLTFLLSLNSKFDAQHSSQKIYDIIGEELNKNYNYYVKDILHNDNVGLENPIFGTFVLYPDEILLENYIDLFLKDRNKFIEYIRSDFNKNKFIQKRILNCQKSALKSESVLFSLYKILDDIEYKNKGYDNIVTLIIDSLTQMFNDIEYLTANKLFYFEDNCLELLKKFLLNLSEAEKEEILLSLHKKISESELENKKKCKFSRLDAINKIADGRGYNVTATTTSRRGQRIFKRNIINILGENFKCAIDNCNISGERFLVASHIYPWKLSDEKQKIDGNNGLLLCPNHDFLFDSLLISFDSNGNILISNEIDEKKCEAFGINKSTKIDLSPENEVYMKMHRKAFYTKGWEY